MATLAVITTLLFFGGILFGTLYILEYYNDQLAGLFALGTLISAYFIGFAIIADINPEQFNGNTYITLSSLVGIGLISIITFGARIIDTEDIRFDFSKGKNLLGTIIQIIGLIASILGIISFYFDFLN